MDGAALDLSEPQAFKNVPLQMMVNIISTFRRIFHKNLHHIQVFDVRYKWKNGNGTFLPLPASASTKICRFHRFRFQIPVYNITKCCILPWKISNGLKLPGLCPNFCQISIARQHTKYKDYKPIQKCEGVNIKRVLL